MRFYRALLALYPASFRAEYAGELCRTFAARSAGSRGPLRRAALAWQAVVDVVPNAIAAHLEILHQDVGYTVRSLARAPGFALTVVLVVALGVGANTAVFSVANLVFVRPLPYAHPEQLLKLWQGSASGRSEVSPADWRDWQAQTRSFSGMEAYTFRAANLVGHGEPRRLKTVCATPGLLPLMGVPPRLGRAFSAADLGRGACVMLSDALWRNQFASDPAVLGSSVALDGVAHTVLGVMPPEFQFPDRTVEAWSSLALDESSFRDRGDTYLEVVARLRPSVTAARARQELAVVGAHLARDFPNEDGDSAPLALGLRDEIAGSARLLVLALCGAALCVLLLACANLASLFLARGAYRGRELAVRAALGAGSDRLVRQLVTESLAIALAGGLVGIAAAAVGVPLLARLIPDRLPLAGQPLLDPRVLVFALGLVLFTGIAFGLAPALQAGGSDALDALRTGSRGTGGRTRRVRASLVVIEVAASVVLLVMSGLLIRAVLRIESVPTGFVAEHVVTLRTALPLPRYDPTAARVRFYDRVLDQVRSLPGVRAAAYATGLPLAMRGGIWGVGLAGGEPERGDRHSVSLRYVTPQYFAALGIPVQRGRDVAGSDTREQPFVAVVSERFARQSWPGQDAIGRRFTVALSERTVVGVVGEVRVRGREQESEPQVYLPCAQVADSSIIGYIPKDLAIRTGSAVSAAALVPRVRAILRAVDPEQPVSDVRTLSDILAEETAPRLLQLRLLAALSGIALLIAGLGIHGLLTFTVSRRTQELGVRLALGAQVGQVVGLVLREGLTLVLTGLAGGVLVAYGAARTMGALLAGVRPEDPLTFSAAALLCLATALAGCLRPALRAARVDPLEALRTE